MRKKRMLRGALLELELRLQGPPDIDGKRAPVFLEDFVAPGPRLEALRRFLGR